MVHVILFAMLLLADEMSGEVGDWFVCGICDGVLVFSMICDESWMSSAMSSSVIFGVKVPCCC